MPVGGPGPVCAAILSSDVTCLDLRLNLLSFLYAAATERAPKERISERDPERQRGKRKDFFFLKGI